MEQANVETNQAARMKIYNQAEQRLGKDVAWLPMYQVFSTYLLKPDGIGVVDNYGDLTSPDDWGNIYIAAH